MNVPSAAIVTPPLWVVANVPRTASTPPDAITLCPTYAVLNVPFGNAALGLRVTVIVGQVTVSVYDDVPKQRFVSVTLTVIGKLPTWFVVPESTPEVPLSVMPVGSAPVS